MPASLEAYHPFLVAYVALGVLVVVQMLVADVAGMRAGHVPGTPVGGGHDDFFFRATRAHANTNESLGVFVVLSLAALLLAASPWWTNLLVGAFTLSRAAHMLAYYADLRAARSAAFSVGVLCLIGLVLCAAAAAG